MWTVTPRRAADRAAKERNNAAEAHVVADQVAQVCHHANHAHSLRMRRKLCWRLLLCTAKKNYYRSKTSKKVSN